VVFTQERAGLPHLRTAFVGAAQYTSVGDQPWKPGPPTDSIVGSNDNDRRVAGALAPERTIDPRVQVRAIRGPSAMVACVRTTVTGRRRATGSTPRWTLPGGSFRHTACPCTEPRCGLSR